MGQAQGPFPARDRACSCKPGPYTLQVLRLAPPREILRVQPDLIRRRVVEGSDEDRIERYIQTAFL